MPFPEPQILVTGPPQKPEPKEHRTLGGPRPIPCLPWGPAAHPHFDPHPKAWHWSVPSQSGLQSPACSSGHSSASQAALAALHGLDFLIHGRQILAKFIANPVWEGVPPLERPWVADGSLTLRSVALCSARGDRDRT